VVLDASDRVGLDALMARLGMLDWGDGARAGGAAGGGKEGDGKDGKEDDLLDLMDHS
jgi:hypothetical protein